MMGRVSRVWYRLTASIRNFTAQQSDTKLSRYASIATIFGLLVGCLSLLVACIPLLMALRAVVGDDNLTPTAINISAATVTITATKPRPTISESATPSHTTPSATAVLTPPTPVVIETPTVAPSSAVPSATSAPTDSVNEVPTGTLRFRNVLGEGFGVNEVVPGSNYLLEVVLVASEPTKWNAPAFTSDCPLSGLPTGFATDLLITHTITTTVHIPEVVYGRRSCMINGTVTTYGSEFPTTTFELQLHFGVQGNLMLPTPEF